MTGVILEVFLCNSLEKSPRMWRSHSCVPIQCWGYTNGSSVKQCTNSVKYDIFQEDSM